jgi:uncharacterized membrane protein YesL
MVQGFLAGGRGLKNLWFNGYPYIWANLAFIVLSLPVFTAPAAYSALVRIGHESQTNPSEADLALFWRTFRKNLLPSLPWGIANFVFAFISFSNFLAYNEAPAWWVQLLRIGWLASSFVWLGVLIYTWPIYYEMETPSVWGATRNAIVMTLLNPTFTLAVLILLLVISMVSTVLTMSWLILSWGAVSAVVNAAVLDRVARIKTP